MSEIRREYTYSYLPCSSCVGKTHCRQCGDRIRGIMNELYPGIKTSVDHDKRRFILTGYSEKFDDNELQDRLEGIGVLADLYTSD